MPEEEKRNYDISWRWVDFHLTDYKILQSVQAVDVDAIDKALENVEELAKKNQ